MFNSTETALEELKNVVFIVALSAIEYDVLHKFCNVKWSYPYRLYNQTGANIPQRLLKNGAHCFGETVTQTLEVN